MPTSLEDKRKQYRIIYELLWSRKPRIYVKDVASILKVDPRTASRRMMEAFNHEYVLPPQIRKRSYSKTKEYIYLVNCKDPLNVYSQYREDMTVVYHAVLSGFANLWIVSKERIDIDGSIMIEGYRSDYHVAYAPNHSWEKAIQIMQEKVKTFDPEDYKPKGIIRTHWDEPLEWDAEDEQLFRYFKYDLRKPFAPVMRKHLISTTKIYQFLGRLPQCCTVFTRYFPETLSGYEPVLYMFKTDYEDFLIDLFSELPTSSFFFKASDRLVLAGRMERKSLRNLGSDMDDISQLWIPLLIRDLKEKGVIEEEAHAIFEYHWKKAL